VCGMDERDRLGACLFCRRVAKRREVYLRHKSKMLQKTQEWRVNSPAEYLLSAAKQRARRGGLPFDIDVTDIIVPERCPILGFPLIPLGGKRTDATPSLDRIEAVKGYVKGNVWVISWRANRLKNDATLTELKALVSGLQMSGAWLNMLSSRRAGEYFRTHSIRGFVDLDDAGDFDEA
jgi:hypothetical protein